MPGCSFTRKEHQREMEKGFIKDLERLAEKDEAVETLSPRTKQMVRDVEELTFKPYKEQIAEGKKKSEKKEKFKNIIHKDKKMTEEETEKLRKEGAKVINSKSSREDLLEALVETRVQMLQQEKHYKNMEKKHKELTEMFVEQLAKFQTDIQLLQEKDAQVNTIVFQSKRIAELEKENEEMKKEMEDNPWDMENENIIANYRKVMDEIDEIVPELKATEGGTIDHLVDWVKKTKTEYPSDYQELRELVEEYKDCSLRDQDATPQQLEDYQHELTEEIDENSKENERLHSKLEVAGKTMEKFRESIKMLKREVGEARMGDSLSSSEFAKSEKRCEKLVKEVEELKKEKVEMKKEMEAMKMGFSVVSTKLEIDKKLITRAENAEEMLDNIGYEYDEEKEWWVEKAEMATKEDEPQLAWGARVDSLRAKFDIWREYQCESNPQYGISDEMAFLLHEDDAEGCLAKVVFNETYPGQYKMEWNPEEGEWEYEAIEDDE